MFRVKEKANNDVPYGTLGRGQTFKINGAYFLVIDEVEDHNLVAVSIENGKRIFLEGDRRVTRVDLFVEEI